MMDAQDWNRTNAGELVAAVAEFEATLPGWWWSVGACSISRDASCGPDLHGIDAHLLASRKFDEGFHVDLVEGSLADALRCVMHDAVADRGAAVSP